MMTTKKYIVMLMLLLTGAAVKAQVQTQAEKDAYTKSITDRSAKYVIAIGITDTLSPKFKTLRDILVDQYRVLGAIHDTRNAQVKEIKASVAEDKNVKIAAADSLMGQQLAVKHTAFLAKLGKELSADQVEKVKDQMTYNKVAVTYNAYLDELPQLTDVQKAQLKAWLVEAREKAIDGGSSDEKTAIFGKYKGRINNYLSAQGFDMKKAGEEWQKRIKERAATKNQ
jgi:hypothetical protein